MKLNSRLTNGLAWAGVALVVGVPAANLVWPEPQGNKQVLTAAIAPEAPGPDTAAAGTDPAPIKAAAVSAASEPGPTTDPNRPMAPVAAESSDAVSGDSAQASRQVANLGPTAAAPESAGSEAVEEPQPAGPRVEATTSSLTIIPGGKTGAPPEPAAPSSTDPVATASSWATPKDTGSTDSGASADAGGEAETEVASVASQPEVPPMEMDTPEVPPVPAPLSLRPKGPAVMPSRTASISVSSHPSFEGGAVQVMPDSQVVIEAPGEVRPLPVGRDAPIVTEDELRGWKSGTLAQYLASKQWTAEDHRAARPRLYHRGEPPRIVGVPSDGQYYDLP
jgi:hypothetical protein